MFCVAATQPVRIGMPLGDSDLRQQLQRKLTSTYSALGYSTEFIALPSERRLKLLTEGLLDGDLFRICQLEQAHSQLITVPVPLDTLQLKAYSLSPDTLKNWQQRNNLLISHIHGFKMAELQHFAGKRITVKSDAQAFGLMLQSRVDIVLEDSHTAAQFLATQPSRQPIYTQHVADFTICHIIHVRLQPLLPQLTQQLR